MTTLDPTQPSRIGPGAGLEFEMLISDLSSRLIGLRPDELDHEIEEVLRRVCELLEVDHALLWQRSGVKPEILAPTHGYCARAPAMPLKPIDQERFPWTRQLVLAGSPVVVPTMEELPSEATVDRESWGSAGILSALCLPLVIAGGVPAGALGFHTTRARREWPEALVRRLQLIAQVFTNALDRRRHELDMRESEARLTSGAELAGLGYYQVNFVEGVAYTDARFREICGISAEESDGLGALQAWIERLHPDDRRRVLEVRRQLHDGELEQVSAEYRFMTPRDGQKWVHHLGRVSERDAAGQARITFGVLRDITARKHAEEELSDLGRRLIQAHEEERALLARELHDDLTQRLAVLAIDVGRTELASPDPAVTAAMRAVREELVRLSEEVHSLAYQLHPSVLDELGLVEALRTECERRRRRLDIELALDCDGRPAVVEKETALCLFRVAQEALNNVARHAGGRAAKVFLRQVDGGLLLEVRDDGVGFDPASRGNGQHLGLLSMRERVRLVGGTLDVESAPGRGTSIRAWAPTRGSSR